MTSSEPGVQAVHRGAYLTGAVEVQFDGADRGLVQQAGHVSLEYHVTAQSGRRRHGLISAGVTGIVHLNEFREAGS